MSSEVVSYQIAYITAFFIFLRAIYIFKDFKRKQLEKTMFNKKYYSISVKDFSIASTIVLSFYIVLNFIISIF